MNFLKSWLFCDTVKSSDEAGDEDILHDDDTICNFTAIRLSIFIINAI